MEEQQKTPRLEEGRDYHYEGPYLVFTASYLRSRGYCCEAGCRHCPWGFRRDRRIDVPFDE